MVNNNPVRNFFFHPFSKAHNTATKIASVVTTIALSILTASIFLFVFIGINLKDRKVTAPLNGSNNTTTIHNSAPNVPVQNNDQPEINQPEIPILVSPKIKTLKEKHQETLKKFEEHLRNGQIRNVRSMHYDWWMFPINRSSMGHGDKYKVSAEDIRLLRSDQQFMNDYRRGVEIVMLGWGWDVVNSTEANNGEAWDNYQVRLGKMLDSLRLFEEWNLFNSVKKFAMKNGENNMQGWIRNILNSR